MKTSAVVLAASATLAMAQPKFLNTNFDVIPGEPFTLKFSGCESGCEIILLNGDSKDLKEVQTLVKDVKGSEETITLSDKFTKDVYAFRIVDADGEQNYSEQFTFDGAEAPSTTAEETTAEETSTVAETTSSEETSTAEETTTSTEATTTSAEETTTISTPESSSTESETPTSTDSDNSEETDDNSDSAPDDDGAAVRLGSSHAALAAAVVALAGYFL
ncbi:ser-Thr-rich glycosyl-phosphatidyl-inositol-anchored membrane family protein [Sarocladium implicatum]|nr:ser-Thr-rich glycosyl-phosphatidyl-inositol-anchored membrane family protein [Sarocladium implicatum]